MEQVIKEVRKSCLCCSSGMGLFKSNSSKLEHLDLFASYEAGAIYTCTARDLIWPYILEVDLAGNPVFKKEFEEAYKSIEENISNDMTKEEYSFNSWSFSLGRYFQDFYDEEYDKSKTEGLTYGAFESYYEEGLTIKQALDKYFL